LSRTWSRTTRLTQIPPGLSQGFEARRDIDPVTEDVVRLGNHITEVDAETKLDALTRWDIDIALGYRPLHLDRAAHCIHHTRELYQHAVAGVLHDPAVMFAYGWINQFAEKCPEALVRAFLIRPHQPRIAGHISGEDGGKTAFDGLFHVLPRRGDHSRTVTADTERKSHGRAACCCWQGCRAANRPTCGKSCLTPQVTAPEIGRNSRGFHTAV
jgi:hypothetical protein